ncbi:ribonuclease PH [Melissococcus plutonius]|uniref:Multifunctional fusion protein n=1 Tax=Melissococcus plutonius TaxID=33970 RepID=A0A2Z5Y2M6_9ENTE|nr:ribonuclease PH [Melissococcus plutonius]BAL62175.1 ribonuclease PH [Melissococcus plutonius DAT561]MCV2497943.1 ribonuclease PH [Melissococcus plutonius]MCV2501634.1 ribonuclease PH [Melissococcus plutonius]MCV2506558.1 ribonuclease PH [Melissococcus plutonius]MCV2519118.1 ribonuclease PH [Melissococcus plutonius]
MIRNDGRGEQQLRSITIETNVFKYPEGSVVISFGDTKVICSATIEEKVPFFLKDSEKGWVTAEYSMLPRATQRRNRRDSNKGKLNGRATEIQRLISRSLRAVVDLEKLTGKSIIIDCDVIQADGGTRTASITGAFVALKLAVEKLLQQGLLTENPIKEYLAAVSVGMLSNDNCITDLNYEEDAAAKVDMNLVMTETGNFVEIQGTGEEATFSGEELNTMLFYGKQAIEELISIQKQAIVINERKSKKVNGNTIVIATSNLGKANEFKKIFEQKGYQVKTLLDYPELPKIEETGKTFEENARLKAETIASILNQPVLADDSGLIVKALDGMPGIYSARFAGEPTNDAANNARLLYEMTNVPKEDRQATFHCTLVLAAPKMESLVVSGEWQGEIATIPRGEHGFGYDPLFYVPEFHKTSAEMSNEEKNRHSHRAKAIENLEQKWKQWIARWEMIE